MRNEAEETTLKGTVDKGPAKELQKGLEIP